MKYLISLVCGLVMASLLLYPDSKDTRTLGLTKLVAEQKVSGSCVSDSDLATSLTAFSSPALKPEWHREVLLSYASKSPQCRAKIVGGLLRAMNKPDLKLKLDQESFFLWHYGGEVLRALQASEALDLLIANLGVTDGESIQITHYPAVETVIGIGAPSISKLRNSLMHEQRAGRRSLIVFCIAKIGGASAKQTLAEALPTENNKCVSNFMRITLRLFSNPKRPNRLPTRDNPKWISAFFCTDESQSGGSSQQPLKT